MVNGRTKQEFLTSAELRRGSSSCVATVWPQSSDEAVSGVGMGVGVVWNAETENRSNE